MKRHRQQHYFNRYRNQVVKIQQQPTYSYSKQYRKQPLIISVQQNQIRKNCNTVVIILKKLEKRNIKIRFIHDISKILATRNSRLLSSKNDNSKKDNKLLFLLSIQLNLFRYQQKQNKAVIRELLLNANQHYYSYDGVKKAVQTQSQLVNLLLIYKPQQNKQKFKKISNNKIIAISKQVKIRNRSRSHP
eukprot:TRINITY_DN4206_c0_g2_i1.p2 TRINITY_DN4206_c0_g2~~TRINITY_DN4206_c0_g2_i1.p2  ORF type:complete len:189 (+),score=-13.85 TRINITY_DN4206_c0_g2_i1:1204-1770(+)